MLSFLKRGKKQAPKPVVPTRDELLVKARYRYAELKAKYDAAMDTIDHQRHWVNADSLSPSAAANPQVRRKLRNHSRYECQENSSLAKRLVLLKSKDVIGRCPRPLPDTEAMGVSATTAKQYNRQIRLGFVQWARANQLGRRLRTGFNSYMVDGESFIAESTNPLADTAVSLYLRLYEGDQVADREQPTEINAIDGIRYLGPAVPLEYHVLPEHPGTDRLTTLSGFGGDPFIVPARSMSHLFREDRPEQLRGIPHTTPALPLFAFRRRFLLATIAAAEIAADFAAVIHTNGTAESGDSYDPRVEPFDVVDIDRGMMTAMPHGWSMEQFKAEHPNATFADFDDALAGEVSRCLLVPFNRALGRSSGYTFAAGKLDRDDYLEGIEVEQEDVSGIVLDKIFNWWLAEAAFVPGVLPARIATRIREGSLEPSVIPRRWFFDRKREAEPQKQAQADKIYWDMGLLLDDEFFTRINVDPDEAYEKLKNAIGRRREIGAPLPGGGTPVADDESDLSDVDDEELENEAMERAA